MRAKDHLNYYSRVYPDAWRHVDTMRADRGKGLPWWPEWCFVPLAATYSIISAVAYEQGVIPDRKLPTGPLVNDVGILGALAAWRVTQGVYRFDSDVFAAVASTPVTGDIPHEVFFNMPEWCVYVETPGLTYSGVQLHGFLAHLEYDAGNSRKELRLVLDTEAMLLSVAVHLGPWSLFESMERSIQESLRHAPEMDPPEPCEMAAVLKGELEALVSLLLYLCAVNGEIGDGDKRPIKPKSTKTKKGPRMFPPDNPRTWDVGVRMGVAIHQQPPAAADPGGHRGDSAHRASPRAHIRRAHWQGFWSGPRTAQEDRRFDLKWIPPIIVNSSDEGELPVTIRPVK